VPLVCQFHSRGCLSCHQAFSLDHFLLKVGAIKSNLIVIDVIELDGLQFTLEQNINKVNLTQLLSNVEKQDENNISASAKTQDFFFSCFNALLF
jgi:hypothetical protein